MGEAFESAAGRHLDDSTFLNLHDRVDNAAYLAGYVVECSLKLLLAQSRYLAPKSLSHDLTTLSGDALRLASLIAPFVGRYEVPPSSDLDDLNARWSPEMRYAATGSTPKGTAEMWLRAAESVYRALVIKIALDGGTEA